MKGGDEPSRGSSGGFVAVELVAGVALLLLPLALVVLTLPTWSERQAAARAIAREVAREVARAGWCDAARADALVREMVVNLDVPPGRASMALACAPGEELPAGGDVEVAVSIGMPAVHLPAIGDVASWTWTARHRQPVDLYAGAR